MMGQKLLLPNTGRARIVPLFADELYRHCMESGDPTLLADMLEALLDEAERGELKAATLRLELPDGTHHEVALGDTQEEREAVLLQLRGFLRELH